MKNCLALLILLAGAAARADDAAPTQGVLLLRNGQMIEGAISRLDDYYQVAVPDGEIRVRSADVEFCCRTLEEGYLRKRAAITWGNVQDHLLLAQWCLRHGLYRFTADELAEAARIEPKHPMLGVLQRRLELATKPPDKQTEPGQEAAAGPSPDDLDHMIRGMPPGTVETFAQVVQPMLMNHCMASGCHGPQSANRFQLMRTPVTQPAGRRLTQRNLYAVLQHIDCDDVSASRLLTVIRGPHGPVRTAIFTDRQGGQYKRIADWVSQVARQQASLETPLSVNFGRSGQSAAPSADAAPRPLTGAAARAKPLPKPARAAAGAAAVPAGATEEVKPLPTPAATRAVMNKLHLPAPAAKGAPAASADAPATDPFDPELFNARHREKSETRNPKS